jgi:hypothetical protein
MLSASARSGGVLESLVLRSDPVADKASPKHQARSPADTAKPGHQAGSSATHLPKVAAMPDLQLAPGLKGVSLAGGSLLPSPPPCSLYVNSPTEPLVEPAGEAG